MGNYERREYGNGTVKLKATRSLVSGRIAMEIRHSANAQRTKEDLERYRVRKIIEKRRRERV